MRRRPVIRAAVGVRSIAAALSVAAAVSLASALGFAETIKIEVKNLVFSPAKVTAHVGDTIEWANADFVAHTATAKNHEFDVQLPANKSGQTVLKKAGTIDYFCRFHPNMTGTITVEEAK